ncbi:inositol monophosphatase family protein [Criblamydia sequanensis]|uniref:Inositol-1-monophosphatase n=1 Tax=Candidatus Criblamydia sequanensis CRIB-18 TaxID=1437425 RepID=A0A090D2D8_9BACT|nr:inositol monophosphatase family protein [Criblamydia sequanensis]CDR34580.1 Inositol-1-monophosphatase [Criblamydia sequanensis CRIB-18]
MNINLEKALAIAEKASMEGGKILLNHFGKLENVREKSIQGDLVTEADNASEYAITTIIKKHFPSHPIIGEEGGLIPSKDTDYLWAIDPLDGTTNYTHQMPVFAISIGLLYKMEPVVGLVYNPITNELFKAIKEKGAYLNDRQLFVTKTETLSKSLLATGFAYDRRDTKDNNYLEFCYLTSITHGVRRGGSAALDLAFVAAGRYDGFWERGLKIWDIAAGALLVKEAFGSLSSYENGPIDLETGRILATNGLLHNELSETLIRVRQEYPPILFR